MKIIDCRQNTTEWLYARLGRPTASEFDNLLTPEWKIRTGRGVESYMYRKLCEKIMGFPLKDSGSWAMEQGSILENEAVPYYELLNDVTVQRVGFITSDDGLIGCSPDGLLGDDSGLEIKCPQPETHLKYLLEGVVPKDYLAQVHGSMFVTGRPSWKFLSYSRQFPPLLVHVQRDEAIQATIRQALDQFFTKFDAAFAKIKAMKDAENAQKQAAYQPDESK